MKLYFTFFLLIFFFATKPLAAQQSILEQKISLKFKNNTLQEAFAEIETLTAIQFAYSSDFLPEERFSRRFKNQKLKTILDRLLAKTNLIYIAQNKRILITLRKEPELSEAPPKNKKFTLNGYLRDATNGEELIGGTVFILQTGSGSNSNAYGFYSLTLPEGHYHLTFSYLGYESQ
jgi:type II secretory pathway component GspD/PulD (secretin)